MMIIEPLAIMNNISINKNESISNGKSKTSDPDGVFMSYKRNKNNPTVNRTNVMHVPRSKTRSVSNPVTPSMSSVISQIKHLSKNISNEGISTDQHTPINRRRVLSDASMINRLNEFTYNNENNNNNVHPLDTQYTSNTIQWKDYPIPSVKLLNLQDLELQDTLTTRDIAQLIPPTYVRPTFNEKRILNSNNTYNNKEKIIQDNKNLELEVWPNSIGNSDVDQNRNALAPNTKKIRQRSMNPNFLKLLAIERRSIDKNILPEVHIDNQTFNNLSTHPDTHIVDKLDFNNDIKLAIRTKLKIWNALGRGQLRNDTYGDSSPWNMKFIPAGSNEDNITINSVVRRNSSLKLSYHDTENTTEQQIALKPCGKLTNGSQYVVKGWCDSRFF